MTRIAYSHGGRQGDCIFSLFAARQYAKGIPFDLHLKTNVQDDHDPSDRKVMQTPEEAEFLASILREQPYIRNITIGDNDCIPAADINIFIDLDRFRSLPSVYGYSEIRYWYTRILDIKDLDVTTPVLAIPDSELPHTNKLCLCLTERYQPKCDFHVLKPFADQLVFIGLPKEHRRFCELFFELPYRASSSLKELLQYTSKSKGWISNIGGLYAAHEAAAIPRILCLPDGTSYGDVRPYTPNGKGVIDNHKLIKQVESLLSA